MPAVSNMLSLPIEIWRNRILSQLSVNDQCRLDSAVQNRTTRETLHEALFGSEIPFETIITPEIIEWIMNKGIRPLQIKITEDITANDMLRFTEFCPQIKSIDTCRYEDDVQDVQEKSRMDDDDDAEYEARDMDETSLSNILLICKSLKKLRICDFQPEEWWDVLPRIMPMCGQLDELTYNEPRPFNDGGRLDYTFFSLTRTKFHIKAEKMVDLGCVVLRALSSLQIAELKLDIAGIGGDFTDTEVSKIARCCPLLEVAEIDMCLSIGAFIDFCQCCNHLTDLSIHDVHEDYFWDPACIRRACSFLHDLKKISFFTPRSTENYVFRAMAVALGGQLQILGVSSTKSLSMECWRYMLQKCPNLRTIQSQAGCGTGKLRVLARRHGVRIEHVGENR